jgi:hypothetical protein
MDSDDETVPLMNSDDEESEDDSNGNTSAEENEVVALAAEEETEDKAMPLVPTRRVSSRTTKGKNRKYDAYFALGDVMIFQLPPTPADIVEALSEGNPFRYFWYKGVLKEIEAIADIDTFSENPTIPEGVSKKAMKTMFVFRVTRRNGDEAVPAHTVAVAVKVVRDLLEETRVVKDLTKAEIIAMELVFKFKARLVVKGCSAIFGIHYDKTFSPTIHFRSLLILLHIQSVKGWCKSNIDITNAYINAFVDINKVVLITLPTYLTGGVGVVCRLLRNLYGTKDAGLLWYELMTKFLVDDLGFLRSIHDPCVFFKFSKGSCGTEPESMVALYVDDLEIGGNTIELIDEIKAKAKAKFGSITDMGQLTSYLGMEIEDIGEHIKLFRRDLIDALEQKMKTEAPDKVVAVVADAKKPRAQVIPTPLPPSFNVMKELKNEGAANILEPLGKLSYEANRGRPDIKFPCSFLGSKATCAPGSILKVVEHLQRYLVATKDLTLKLGGDDKEIVLFGYADASFSKSGEGCLSYLGYCFFLGKDAGTISNASSKIKTACTSSTEAEIKALREALKEVVWMRGLLAELGIRQTHPTVIFQDNKSTIELCSNERSVNLSKHVIPLLAVIREAIRDGIIKLVYCPTRWMVADILTSNASRGDEYRILRTIFMLGHKYARELLIKEGKDFKDSPLNAIFG